MTNEPPLRPKMLDDVAGVEGKLFEMLDEGRGREAIRMVLALLVDLRERNLSAEARLQGLLRKVYGRSSERVSAAQLELLLTMMGIAKAKPEPEANANGSSPNLPAPDTKPAPKREGAGANLCPTTCP